MKIKCLVALAWMIAPQFSRADLRSDFIVCASNIDSAARLACFDKMAGELKSARIGSAGVGKWMLRTEISKFDDSRVSTASLPAESPARIRYDFTTPILFVRCTGQNLDLTISYGVFLGGGSTRISSRLDRELPRESEWVLGNDKSSIRIKGSTLKFFEDMAKFDTLLVDLRRYGEDPVMSTFDLRGFSEVRKGLREKCTLTE